MKRRRVKITGIGPVTPAGIGREGFWRGILEPVSRIRPFTKLADELGPFVAATVEDFKVEQFIPKNSIPKGAARHTLFAIAGASLAVKDCGISMDELRRLPAVVVAGACIMDFEVIVKSIDAVTSRGIRAAVGRGIYTTNAAAISAAISESLDLRARTMSIQSACCTGLDAVGYAARLVSTGEADIAICGGTDAPLVKNPLVELRSIGMTPGTAENAARINRPFDMWRTTGVVSEGACMFVIEPDTSPRPHYSFIDGYAYENDVPELVCSGMSGAMTLAMADAKIKPQDIEVISAWGPGHRLIDTAEAAELKRVFGGHLSNIPAVSIKGAVGNPLGAAPAMQIAAAALGQRGGLIPPTVNWQFPDPACPLNLCDRMRYVDHNRTMVNAHGISGVNSSLVLQRC